MSGNGKMKNIDVLHQINILRIYINSFEIKCFYLDFKTNPHFSFCQTSTSHREIQMSTRTDFSRGIILNQILNICVPPPEISGVKLFYKKLSLPAAAQTTYRFTIWMITSPLLSGL